MGENIGLPYEKNPEQIPMLLNLCCFYDKRSQTWDWDSRQSPQILSFLPPQWCPVWRVCRRAGTCRYPWEASYPGYLGKTCYSSRYPGKASYPGYLEKTCSSSSSLYNASPLLNKRDIVRRCIFFEGFNILFVYAMRQWFFKIFQKFFTTPYTVTDTVSIFR